MPGLVLGGEASSRLWEDKEMSVIHIELNNKSK